jgi:hypothetical protein
MGARSHWRISRERYRTFHLAIHQLQQFAMFHLIKEALQVYVNDVLIALIDVLLRPLAPPAVHCAWGGIRSYVP